ncbi:hypothetical protein Taro_055860 [Colocasia esculenta]|uniref:non-specific serine/threonine protein kinase n=1 Tax=Colocasia esculenta TaxID=4460 RepID=A0A843XUI6_COLES|nr:hypothetical protein [Colocasia esculenta]
MLSRILLCFFLLRLAAPDEEGFLFNGFQGAHLNLDGAAEITSEGLVRLTNSTAPDKSHVFFGDPVRFKGDPGSNVYSFSSCFVFGIVPLYPGLSGHGVAFFISPSKDLHGTIGSQYMGLFNTSNNGNPSNHIFAVELDTVRNPEFGDIDDNHVGIDINSMSSFESRPVGFYANSSGRFENLSLISGGPIQVWVEYDGERMQVNVTVSPMEAAKPSVPLLSSVVNLSSVLLDRPMYVGLSSSSNTFLSSHYLMGWSFKMNGAAQALNISGLPALPRNRAAGQHPLEIWLRLAVALSALVAVASIIILVRRKIKYAELLEDWEKDYRHRRFPYKELFDATHGFDEKGLLGEGGFGRVYNGILPRSKVEVAIKRISHESSHGMKQFIAEIVSIGRLRHRHLVEFLGYCRRRGELLLVYNLMPGGSLDKLLFDHAGLTLEWKERLRIIKGVAAGLLYLHEEWEKVVIHRDVKASNVLLDSDFNGRLGDFGLARLYDHGSDPQRTQVFGTVGYLAPEMIRTRRATKATDVFAFGVFLLEVACGRRPVDPKSPEVEMVLVDWVLRCWRSERILQVVDPRMREYVAEEVETVLKLGLLCCDPLPGARPSMRQVSLFLEGLLPLPESGSSYLDPSVTALMENEALDVRFMSYSPETVSLLYVGR